MPLRLRKTYRLGPRWLHLALNATQAGPSSWSFRLGPTSWNSRQRAWRLDLPGPWHWTSKGRGREPKTGGPRRGAASTDREKPAEPRPPGMAGPGRNHTTPNRGGLIGWILRWMFRGARWTTTQAATRSSNYARRAAEPWQQRAAEIREFGFRPVVRDIRTDEVFDARRVHLDPPTGGDPDVRLEQKQKLAEQMMRDQQAWETWARRPRRSWADRLRRRPPAAPSPSRAEVLAHTDAAHYRRPAAAWSAAPQDPARRPAGGRRKETAVANAVNKFDDLHDPQIDPLNYPEELPEHLAGVRDLLGSEAEGMTESSDDIQKQASAMRAYADYMLSAEADPQMCAAISDAADATDALAQQIRDAAEKYEQARDLLEAARARAEAEYGDRQVPRFDRAG